jgi:hypothetical protein
MKFSNIIVILITSIMIGCNQSVCTDTTNLDIYKAIKIFRAEFPLNATYGLEENPLKSLDYGPPASDSTFLQMHLIDINSKGIKKSRPSGILGGVSIDKCLTQDDISYMMTQLNRKDNFRWNSECANLKNTNKFKQKYAFSVPLFSKDKTKFIIAIENYNAGGLIVLFKKENDTWIAAIESHWIH